MIDEYKEYILVETVCKQCGRHITHEANFVAYQCECGNGISITAFHKVNKVKEKLTKDKNDKPGQQVRLIEIARLLIALKLERDDIEIELVRKEK